MGSKVNEHEIPLPIMTISQYGSKWAGIEVLLVKVEGHRRVSRKSEFGDSLNGSVC